MTICAKHKSYIFYLHYSYYFNVLFHGTFLNVHCALFQKCTINSFLKHEIYRLFAHIDIISVQCFWGKKCASMTIFSKHRIYILLVQYSYNFNALFAVHSLNYKLNIYSAAKRITFKLIQ